jgi:chitinase
LSFLAGEILDIAEIAATPALINLCVKDIEKEGKAEFKVFGKEHTLSMSKPTATKEDRPSESSHSSASTSSCGNAAAKRAGEPGRCDPQFNKAVTTSIVDDWAALPVNPIICATFGQACYNYRSVVNLNVAFQTLTCAYRRPPITRRPVYDTWLNKHKTALWDPLIVNLPLGGCSPDEYPPAVIADVNDGFNILTSTLDVAPRVFVDHGQRIRYLAAAQNRPAGKLFDRCGQGPFRTLDSAVESITAAGRRKVETTYTKYRAVFTRSRFTLNFAGLDSPADDGITSNPCIPTVQGVVHPGFQLAIGDEWFRTNAAELAYTSNYASSPTKRDWIEGRGLVMIDGNSSRVATPEELRQEFGFDSCSDDSCSRELKALRAVSDAVKEDFSLPPPPAPPTKPSAVDAEATPSPVNDTAIARDEPTLISLPGSNPLDTEFPAETGRAARMPKKFPKFSRGRGKH